MTHDWLTAADLFSHLFLNGIWRYDTWLADCSCSLQSPICKWYLKIWHMIGWLQLFVYWWVPNTIIRQSTRVTNILQYVTNTKWKWAGHIARMKDNRWSTRTTEWQTKGVWSVGRPKRRWRDDIVGQQGAVWTRIAKDRERWRTLAEGYFLQWKDTA